MIIYYLNIFLKMKGIKYRDVLIKIPCIFSIVSLSSPQSICLVLTIMEVRIDGQWRTPLSHTFPAVDNDIESKARAWVQPCYWTPQLNLHYS